MSGIVIFRALQATIALFMLFYLSIVVPQMVGKLMDRLFGWKSIAFRFVWKIVPKYDMIPPKKRWKGTFVLCYIESEMIHLLLVFFFVSFIYRGSFNILWGIVMRAVVAFNVLVVAYRMIPMDRHGYPNTGKILKAAFKTGDANRWLGNLLETEGELANGKRIREFDEKSFELPADCDLGNYIFANVAMLKAAHLRDVGYFDESMEVLEKIPLHKISSFYRNSILMSKLYYFSAYRLDEARAKDIYERKEFQSFLRTTTSFSTLAAYQFFVEKNSEMAFALLDRAKRQLGSLDKGLSIMEMEKIVALEKRFREAYMDASLNRKSTHPYKRKKSGWNILYPILYFLLIFLYFLSVSNRMEEISPRNDSPEMISEIPSIDFSSVNSYEVVLKEFDVEEIANYFAKGRERLIPTPPTNISGQERIAYDDGSWIFLSGESREGLTNFQYYSADLLNTMFFLDSSVRRTDSEELEETFDFATKEEALAQVKTTLKELGITTFEVFETYSLSAEWIREKSIENNNSIFGSWLGGEEWDGTHDYYYFHCYPSVDGVPISNLESEFNQIPTPFLTVAYSEVGIEMILASNVYAIREQIEQGSILTEVEALEKMDEYYTKELTQGRYQVEKARLEYVIENMKETYVLKPIYRFRVRRILPTERGSTIGFSVREEFRMDGRTGTGTVSMTGTYVQEGKERTVPGTFHWSPHIVLFEDNTCQLEFSGRSLLVAGGRYEVREDKLIIREPYGDSWLFDGSPVESGYTYYFQIEANVLVYLERASHPSRQQIVEDRMRFTLRNR